jgi:phosphoglycolate phosphatase-like HAD superfamily hydrolase
VKVAVDLDGVVGDTRPLWLAWLEDARRRFRAIAELDPGSLPPSRGAAADALDEWATQGIGDWRGSLERFAEDHAPLYLRPDAAVVTALRRLQAGGARIVAFTDAPEALAQVAAAHLGIARRLEALEFGAGAEARAAERLGDGAVVVRKRDELLQLGAVT